MVKIFLGLEKRLENFVLKSYCPKSSGGHMNRDGILRVRREHARGRNLADCGRICGSPLKICRLNLRNVEEMFQRINNAESHSKIVKIILWKRQ